MEEFFEVYCLCEVVMKFVEKIREEVKIFDGEIRIMYVCGIYEDMVMRYGICLFFLENVKVVSGLGCLVCIILVEDIVVM